MKKRFLAALATGLLVVGMGGIVQAVPIVNTDNDGFEDVWVDIDNDGVNDSGEMLAYDHYQNSGELLFIAPGNNLGNAADLESVRLLTAAELNLDPNTFTLTKDTNVTLTYYDDPNDDTDGLLSGTWTATPLGNTISLYAIKAATWYAMYVVDPAASTGSWSTFDLWIQKNKGEALEISHFTGYDSNQTPVPEPATMLLFGTGLAGLAGIARRRKKN